MLETALNALYEQDSYAAITYLNRQSDPLAVVQAYDEIVRELYWKRKDLQALLLLAPAGIQYGVTVAQAMNEEEQAYKVRSAAKGIAYNLASFTWPGWNEPGIVLTAAHLTVGLDAARANLRFAKELQKDDLPMARAYWMLAAHQMAAGDREAAHRNFAESARLARAAGVAGEELLAEGFVAMVDALSSSRRASGIEALDAVHARLAALENGHFFRDQLNTAWIVFSHQKRPGGKRGRSGAVWTSIGAPP